MGDLYGTSYIVNGASDVIGLHRLSGDDESGPVRMHMSILKDRSRLSRRGDIYGLLGHEESLDFEVVDLNGVEGGYKKRSRLRERLLMDLLKRDEATALPADELASVLGSHINQVQRELRNLRQDPLNRIVRMEEREGRTTRFRYWREK